MLLVKNTVQENYKVIIIIPVYACLYNYTMYITTYHYTMYCDNVLWALEYPALKSVSQFMIV